jgi:hypothetical protein
VDPEYLARSCSLFAHFTESYALGIQNNLSHFLDFFEVQQHLVLVLAYSDGEPLVCERTSGDILGIGRIVRDGVPLEDLVLVLFPSPPQVQKDGMQVTRFEGLRWGSHDDCLVSVHCVDAQRLKADVRCQLRIAE